MAKIKKSEIPLNAHSLEVFHIKNKEAFIGFKLANGDFHFIQVPYTGKDRKIKLIGRK